MKVFSKLVLALMAVAFVACSNEKDIPSLDFSSEEELLLSNYGSIHNSCLDFLTAEATGKPIFTFEDLQNSYSKWLYLQFNDEAKLIYEWVSSNFIFSENCMRVCRKAEENAYEFIYVEKAIAIAVEQINNIVDETPEEFLCDNEDIYNSIKQVITCTYKQL